jgi:hypothetical protein
LGARTAPASSIIIPQIFREAVGIVEIVPIIEIAVEQRARLSDQGCRHDVIPPAAADAIVARARRQGAGSPGCLNPVAGFADQDRRDALLE